MLVSYVPQAYLSILYLRIPENFTIVLRGKFVKHHNLALDLKFQEFIVYRPQSSGCIEVLLRAHSPKYIELLGVLFCKWHLILITWIHNVILCCKNSYSPFLLYEVYKLFVQLIGCEKRTRFIDGIIKHCKCHLWALACPSDAYVVK